MNKLVELIGEVPDSEEEEILFQMLFITQYLINMHINLQRLFKLHLERYKSKYFSTADIKINPVSFWKLNVKSHPRLSNIAFWLLSAPATNNSSERSFSSAGNVITDKRNRLKSVTVNDVLLIRSNHDMRVS